MSILSRCESRRGNTVRLLAVHSTEGNDTPRVNDAASLRDATWWTGSSHAICDNEALLTPAEGCVPYNLAAWTLRSGNLISENIEQVGWARWSRAEWLAHPGTLEHTARWLADRSKARGIPLVKLSPADVRAGKWGVIGHVDWTVGMKDGSHTDPGPNYPWDVVMARAQQLANGDEDLTPEEHDALIYIRDAILRGGKDASPSGRPLKDLVQEGTADAVWAKPILRPDDKGVLQANPALQELADIRTIVMAHTELIKTVAAAQGLSATDIEAAVAKALKENAVTVDVNVAGKGQ